MPRGHPPREGKPKITAWYSCCQSFRRASTVPTERMGRRQMWYRLERLARRRRVGPWAADIAPLPAGCGNVPRPDDIDEAVAGGARRRLGGRAGRAAPRRRRCARRARHARGGARPAAREGRLDRLSRGHATAWRRARVGHVRAATERPQSVAHVRAARASRTGDQAGTWCLWWHDQQ